MQQGMALVGSGANSFTVAMINLHGDHGSSNSTASLSALFENVH